MAYVAVTLLLMFGAKAWGQQRMADSLLLVLEKYRREDTVRVNRMNDLAYAVYINNSAMAEEYAREAGSLSDKLGYPKGKARSLWLQGLAHLSRNKEEALTFFQQALTVSETINDRQGMANYLIASGNVLHDLGRRVKGDSCYYSALDFARAGGDKNTELKCMVNIARIHTANGEHAAALDLLNKASELARHLDNKVLLARCYNSMGSNYLLQGNYSVSLEYLLRAMRVNEELHDRAGILGNLLNIAGVKLEQRNYEGALESALLAKDLAEEIRDTSLLSICLSNIGSIYLSMEDDKALKYLQEGLALSRSTNKVQRIHSLTNIGVVHSRKGEFAAALENFEEALTAAESIGFKRGMAQALYEMAKIFFLQHDRTRALQYAYRSAELSEQLGLPEMLRDNNKLLADIFAIRNDYKRAYEHHKLYKQFNDSTFNAENVKRIADLESAYRFDKERQFFEAEQQRKDLAIQSQHTIILTLTLAFLFMLLLALTLYHLYKLKRRTNKELLQQKAKIERLQQLEISRMNQELEAGQKAMTAAELKLLQNSERDAQTIKALEETLLLAGNEAQSSIKSLIVNYKHQAYHSNWEEFELLFQKVHHSFYDHLNERFPDLTPNERKLCVFLKLNMNNKQIAQVTFQSEEALKKARLRLRKKLELDRDTNLVAFVQGL